MCILVTKIYFMIKVYTHFMVNRPQNLYHLLLITLFIWIITMVCNNQIFEYAVPYCNQNCNLIVTINVNVIVIFLLIVTITNTVIVSSTLIVNMLGKRQSQTPLSSAFYVQKDFWSKQIFGLIKFWVWKHVGSKRLWILKMSGQKPIWVQKDL